MTEDGKTLEVESAAAGVSEVPRRWLNLLCLLQQRNLAKITELVHGCIARGTCDGSIGPSCYLFKPQVRLWNGEDRVKNRFV